MPSLTDLPDDVLFIIAGFLDTTSLSNYAASHVRLLASATRARHLRASSVTPKLLQLVKYNATNLQSLNLSNCNSSSVSIAALIQKCRSITELNVVNCNLSFTQLMQAISQLTQLETLRCGHLSKGLISDKGFGRQKSPAAKGSKSVRNMYVEVAPSGLCLDAFGHFLRKCEVLERLHLHIIGSCAPDARDASRLTRVVGVPMLQHLKTVIVSSRTTSVSFVPLLERHLLETWRLETRDQRGVMYEDLDSFINTSKNFVVMNPRFVALQDTDFLRDGYRFNFNAAREMSFPWGTPRGPTIECATMDGIARAATFLMEPSSWCEDLVELDLTKCSALLPEGAEWSDLIRSATALRALAISYCFLPPQEMAYHPGKSREPKRQKFERSFLDHLTSTKLRKLYVSGRCCCAYEVPSSPSYRWHRGPPNFIGINSLAHLEELSVIDVTTSEAVFSLLANKNVHSVQLSLHGVANCSKLKEFIRKSVKLKNFKLRLSSFSLSSMLLWDALAEGKSLEQICIETLDLSTVDLSVINNRVPRLLERLRVLHVHAEHAANKNKLKAAIRSLVKEYNARKPDSDLQFETEPTYAGFAFPACFPGRALCFVMNDIAKIKPVGWDM